MFFFNSKGSLLLENEQEIKQKMKETLSFNCAKQDLEFSVNKSSKEDGSARAKAKDNVLSEENIRRQLGLNYKNFKKEYNIFGKLPHFAVYRLKVLNILLQVIIHTIHSDIVMHILSL